MFRKRVDILPSHIFMKLTVGWQAFNQSINPFKCYYYKCDVKSQLCFVTLHLNQSDSSVHVILGWNKKQIRLNAYAVKSLTTWTYFSWASCCPFKTKRVEEKTPAGHQQGHGSCMKRSWTSAVCLPPECFSQSVFQAGVIARSHVLSLREVMPSETQRSQTLSRSRFVCWDADGLNGDQT